MTAVVAYAGDVLTGFAYGHPSWWAEQQYAWAHTLRGRLGEAGDQCGVSAPELVREALDQ